MIIKNLDKKLLTAALKDNMCGKFAYLPKLAADMFVTENEITILNSHQPADMFNIICKTKSSEYIQYAIDVFAKSKLPFAWWVGFKNEPNDLIAQLEKLQLCLTEN